MIRAALALALTVTGSACVPASDTIQGPTAAIDGDTIVVDRRMIRLAGIDAPEMLQRFGPEAATALARFIGRSHAVCQPQGRGRYGRIVARCLVNGRDVGRFMVMNGWAFAYRRYSSRYVADEKSARARGAGLWKNGIEIEKPWRWRRRWH